MKEKDFEMLKSRPDLRAALRQGMEAARANIVPGIILWMIGSAVLISYYAWPSARALMESVGDFEQRYDYVFAIVTTTLFGAVLPILFQLIAETTRRQREWCHLPFLIGFWAWKGVEINFLYNLQSQFFGDNQAVMTVATKVAIDQFVYVPFWAMPTLALCFLWKNAGYSLAQMRQWIGHHWYRDRVFPVMLMNRVIWIPSVTIIYSLPLALQLPLQNIIVCLFVLVVLFLTKERSPASEAETLATSETIGKADGQPGFLCEKSRLKSIA